MKSFKTTLLLFSLLLTSTVALSQNYIEVPEVSPSATYLTTYVQFSDTYTRSFTMKYDEDRHIALWVAYPLNSGLIGMGSRGDGWHADRAIDVDKQAIIYKGFKYGSGYDRGHQIPSADRLDPKANEQTFQFTNATPQLHNFNGGIWAELEKVVRAWAKRSDTLYVVTGAIPGNSTIEDNVGKPVNIPYAYYKTVLRRFTSKTGDEHWSMCTVLLYHEVTKVGTWQENLNYFKLHSLAVKDLEDITGEKYFPLLEEIIDQEQVNKLKNAAPSNNSWWWK